MSIVMVILFLALLFFILATFGVPSDLNLIGLGLALLTIAKILGGQ